jgi:hypothetical protein
MKTKNYIRLQGLNFVLILAVLFGVQIISINNLVAQSDSLLPDQNPNYKKSMEKYMAIKDDYISKEGTTLQNTYKAIDDMEAKKERKALRKEQRHERRMARINNRGHYRYYSQPYYFGYNYHNPYYWGNRWDRYYYNDPFLFGHYGHLHGRPNYRRTAIGMGVNVGWHNPGVGFYYGNNWGFYR